MGQGVYVGAIGRDSVGKIVIVGSGVAVSNGVAVSVGVKVVSGRGESGSFHSAVSRPRATNEAAPRSRTAPAIPPMIQGSQFMCFLTTNLKLGGTEINTTVMLSCPPRELASSISAREASFKLGFDRITSRISSFQSRSVSPSLHKSKISLGRSCKP